jgi:hypothetical protein
MSSLASHRRYYRLLASECIDRLTMSISTKRNNLHIWFLKKTGWTMLEVPTSKIMEAGGIIYQDHTGKAVAGTNQIASILDMIFQSGDLGIQAMKDWCAHSCRDKWRYQPAGCFLFRSFRDAVLFKLTWF